MMENVNLKEKIGDSLKKNLRFKDFLKKILLKLISKSQKKETNLEEAFLKIIKEKEELEKKNKTYEKHLTTILKEKHVKESKLDKVEDELNRLKRIIAEKDKQLKNMQSTSINEKNRYKNNYSKNKTSQSRGRELSKNGNKKIHSSISLEKNYAKNKIIKKVQNETHKINQPQLNKIGKRENILINNLTNSSNNIYDENLTELDRIEINLQDEYVGTKKKFINDINHVSITNNDFNEENKKFVKENLDANSLNNVNADKDDIKIEIDLKNLICNNNASINNQASIQNIKYIINQTNNIVNNNINKIIEKDNHNINNKKAINTKSSYNSLNKFSSNNPNPKTSLNVRESYKEKIKEALNLNTKDSTNPKRNRMNSLQKSTKRNSILSNNVVDFYEEKILKTNNIDVFNIKDSMKMREINKNSLNSPKKKSIEDKLNTQANVSKNKNYKKLKEYDRIIENQLNEVYNKKAKEIGEKIKRNIKNTYSKNNALKRTSLQTSENNVEILSELNQFYNKNDSINEKELLNKQPKLNRSLSLSCVSVNQEVGFCSELDIVDQINDKDLILIDENSNKNKIYAKKQRQDSNSLLNSKYNKKYKKISIIKANNNNNNQNIISAQSSKINDQSNKPIIDNHNKEDPGIQDSEFNINQENVIKFMNIKEDNKRKSRENKGLNLIESNAANKKSNFNINPSPIKIDNHFVNNFINAKKIKPIDFNSSTEFKKNAERYINLPKNVEKLNNLNEFISNIEEDFKKIDSNALDSNKKNKENEPDYDKNSDIQNPNSTIKNFIKDSSHKNTDEKPKKGLMNLIPINKNIANSEVSQKKVACKFNSSKSIHANTLLNSAEIKEDILINVSNLNSNRNKQNKNNNLNSNNNPVAISVSNRLLSNVNVQKFINSPNNNNTNVNSNPENLYKNQANIEKHTNNFNKDTNKNPADIIKDVINIRNTSELNKYISEKEINHYLNEFDLIRNKTNKKDYELPENENNPNLNLSKDKSDFNKNNIRNVKERSSSILKKARMERKIIKNNDFLEIDSHDPKVENFANKSNISNFVNEKQNVSINKIENESSRYSSTNKKNKYSSLKNSCSTSVKNLNNFKYLKNNFNSYKSKKLETNMVRKGSNISKHSVDFVNEYINHKKNKIPINTDNKKEEVEKILVKKDVYDRLSSNEKLIEIDKNLLALKNCDLDIDNIALYNDNATQEIKAIFIQNKKDHQEISESIPNYDKIQGKKYVPANVLSNDFTSKFLSNEKKEL